jgi:AacA4 family aminoglycoside N(6')-acetyltransferase
MNSADPSIDFRPLREADLPLLTNWLNRAHVLEWWSGDDAAPDIEYARKKYLPRMDEASSVKAYIAVLADEPIGFIQSYVAFGCGEGWWEEETDPGVRGIDQFLCDGGRLGQGLGTRMVKAFVQRLLAEPGVTKVQTDPDPANARAVRCYTKAGFRPVRSVTTPDGQALLMIVEKEEPKEQASAA